MDSGLLLRICSIAEAQSLQSRSRFDKLDAKLQDFVSQLAQRSIDDAEHIRSHIDESINELNDKSRRREGLIRSLKFSSMNLRVTSIKNAHLGAFQWIFSSNLPAWAAFVTWLASDEKLYWISGKPGSGKSTLTKFIVADAHTPRFLKAKHGHNFTLFLERRRGDAEIHQGSVNGVGIGRKDNDNGWSTPELRHWIVRILGLYPRPGCIFLDGADEISPKEGPAELMELVQELLRAPKVNLKICISSRPEPAFKKWLGSCPMLRLQDLTNQDIRDVCSATLVPLFAGDDSGSSMTSEASSAETRKLLVDELAAKAEGVFLWVHLALKSVQRGRSNSDSGDEILQRIRQLPAGLKGAPNTLHCKDLEAMCALVVKNIESSCGGFLEVGAQGEIKNPLGQEYDAGGRWDALVPWTNTSVAFIHRMTSDFLTDTESGRDILEKHPSRQDDRLARLYRSALVQLTLCSTTTTTTLAPTSALGPPSAKVDSLAWDMFRFRHIMMGIGTSMSDRILTSKTLSSCEWLWETTLAKKKQHLNGRKVDFLALSARGGYYHFVASRLLKTSMPSSSASSTSPGESSDFKSDSTKSLSNCKVLLVQWLREQGAVSRSFECDFISWTYSPHISLASAPTRTMAFSTPDTRCGELNHVVADGIEIRARFGTATEWTAECGFTFSPYVEKSSTPFRVGTSA
ncbi:hypothetical protein B0H67DRAFT_650262 [Lasiosphaeris hirsuta]|uniref:Nephrocystin 3-like N-terminal domain-containing protein n=1 Tax=Lasiosphaeris hirsuta TaxID=260670 RepID=A0AA39ZRF0_9PEZI|nr:hypothetical protein B0H67DRAFT_650262 [Lasiosphaeris hirsuta]